MLLVLSLSLMLSLVCTAAFSCVCLASLLVSLSSVVVLFMMLLVLLWLVVLMMVVVPWLCCCGCVV